MIKTALEREKTKKLINDLSAATQQLIRQRTRRCCGLMKPGRILFAVFIIIMALITKNATKYNGVTTIKRARE